MSPTHYIDWKEAQLGTSTYLSSSELRFMRYTREIHMHLHFDGLSPFIHTATSMHVLSAVITHPVRGRVFPLAAYSGTAKLNDIERVLASSIDQIASLESPSYNSRIDRETRVAKNNTIKLRTSVLERDGDFDIPFITYRHSAKRKGLHVDYSCLVKQGWIYTTWRSPSLRNKSSKNW